jgi:hypothetical protein
MDSMPRQIIAEKENVEAAIRNLEDVIASGPSSLN